jgi:hypothetical protein
LRSLADHALFVGAAARFAVHLTEPRCSINFDQRRAERRADGVGTLMRNAGPWSGMGGGGNDGKGTRAT